MIAMPGQEEPPARFDWGGREELGREAEGAYLSMLCLLANPQSARHRRNRNRNRNR